MKHSLNIRTFAAIVTSQVEWTLAIESAWQIDTSCSWGTRRFLTIHNVILTVFARKSVENIINFDFNIVFY